MITISSHVLNTVSGVSAIGIRAQLFRLQNDKKIELFDITSDNEGRIVETLDVSDFDKSTDYELVFHSADYYASQLTDQVLDSSMKVVVLRFSMTDPNKRYHMPIMLSPHSYSVWWSK
jgi:5-hydroxyisourate hydrolase